MSTVARSKGAPGPWIMADDSVMADGTYNGPGTDVSGVVTLSGLVVPGDVVNVYENANRIATGPVLSGVQYRK